MARPKLTFEQCREAASQCETKAEFRKRFPKEHKAAHRNGWINDICYHMISLKKTHTKESCWEVALKCNHRLEFQKRFPGEYGAAKRNSWLNEVCSHMEILWEKKHTKESCRIAALQCETKAEFRKRFPKEHSTAQKNGWLSTICGHMKPLLIYHTKESCSLVALQCETKKEFEKGFPRECSASYKHGWINEICSHMRTTGGISTPEKELFKIIKDLHPEAEKTRHTKVNIIGKPHIYALDIDIFIPSLNIGLEFDGRYWHSPEGLKRSRSHWPDSDIQNYHQIKDEYFKSKNIQILHIKEQDWMDNKEEQIKKCMEFLKSSIISAV